MIKESVAEVSRIAVDPGIPKLVKVQRVLWETEDTFTLMLDMGRQELYQFVPGQFNMLYVYGVGEAAISISSDPEKLRTIAHTVHRVGTVTSALARLKRDSMVGIRGPFGKGWPLMTADGKDALVVAGGIGLAPLRPLLYEFMRRRHSFRRIILLFGARSPVDLLYRVELEEWERKYGLEVLVTVDRGDTSWKGHIGVVTNLFSYITLDPAVTIAYVCGPETMMKFTVSELERRGVPSEQVNISMERNMKCGTGFCGHCQFGPYFVCKDGPVFPLPVVHRWLERKEL